MPARRAPRTAPRRRRLRSPPTSARSAAANASSALPAAIANRPAITCTCGESSPASMARAIRTRRELGLCRIHRARGHPVPARRSAHRAPGRPRCRARAHRSIVLAPRALERARPTPAARTVATRREIERASSQRLGAQECVLDEPSRSRFHEQFGRLVGLADLLEVLSPSLERGRIADRQRRRKARPRRASAACAARAAGLPRAPPRGAARAGSRPHRRPVSSNPTFVASVTASPTAATDCRATTASRPVSKSPSTAPAVTTSRCGLVRRAKRVSTMSRAVRETIVAPPRHRAPTSPTSTDPARTCASSTSSTRSGSPSVRAITSSTSSRGGSASSNAPRSSPTSRLPERLEIEHVGDAIARKRAHHLLGQRRLTRPQRARRSAHVRGPPSRDTGSPRDSRDRPREDRRAA